MSCHKVFVNQIHSSMLLRQLACMWKQEAMCDAVIVHDEGAMKVHKLILYAASHTNKDISDREMIIKVPSGVKQESLQIALTYLYDGVLTLTNDNLSDVWKIAHSLNIAELKTCCKRFSESYKKDFKVDLFDIESSNSDVSSTTDSDHTMEHITMVDVTNLSKSKSTTHSSTSQETNKTTTDSEGHTASCTTFELQDDLTLKAVTSASKQTPPPDTFDEPEDYSMDEPEPEPETPSLAVPQQTESQAAVPLQVHDSYTLTQVKQEPIDQDYETHRTVSAAVFDGPSTSQFNLPSSSRSSADPAAMSFGADNASQNLGRQDRTEYHIGTGFIAFDTSGHAESSSEGNLHRNPDQVTLDGDPKYGEQETPTDTFSGVADDASIDLITFKSRPSSGKHRSKYDITDQQRIEIYGYALKHGFRKAGRAFDLGNSTIRYWRNLPEIKAHFGLADSSEYSPGKTVRARYSSDLIDTVLETTRTIGASRAAVFHQLPLGTIRGWLKIQERKRKFEDDT